MGKKYFAPLTVCGLTACFLISVPIYSSLGADLPTNSASLPVTDLPTNAAVEHPDSAQAEPSGQDNQPSINLQTPAVDNSKVTESNNKLEKAASNTTKGGSIGAKSNISAKKLFMWKVERHKGTVYLLGSVHALKPGCYPLPLEMEDAFAKSQVLAVEVDISKMTREEQLKILKGTGLYSFGDQLSNHISKATYGLLEKYLSDAHTPPVYCARMKPWLVSMVLPQVQTFQKENIRSSEGIDRHFLYEARVKGKEIAELETAESQMEIFSKLTEPLQEKLLRISLLSRRHQSSQFDAIVNAWQSGDAQAMERLIYSPEEQTPDLQPFRDALLSKRNLQMTQKIVDYLNTPQTYFVVVGAAHMVGPQGIVNLLQEQKYQVEQVTYVPTATATEPLKSAVTYKFPWQDMERQAEKSISAKEFSKAHQQLTACIVQVSKTPPMLKIDPQYPQFTREFNRLLSNYQIVLTLEIQSFKNQESRLAASEEDPSQIDKLETRRVQCLTELANDCKAIHELEAKLLGVDNPQTKYWGQLYKWTQDQVNWLKL